MTIVVPTLRQFIELFLPIFLGFIFFRLMAQIDLFMLAPFGELYLAAFSVPAKIMMLDLLAAFSIGPVSALYLAQAKNRAEQSRLVGEIVVLCSFVFIIIMLLGFLVYPTILRLAIDNDSIFDAASIILFWSIIGIPFRLLNFVESMMLHGLGRGKIVVFINFMVLLLNAPLNFIFIKAFGVSGIFIATVSLALLSCMSFLLILNRMLAISWRKSFTLKTKFLSDFFRHGRQELSRLFLYLGHGLIVVIILGQVNPALSPFALAAFSAASEWAQMFVMFYVALMRSIAIASSRAIASKKAMLFSWRKYIASLFILSLVFGLFTILFTKRLGQEFFRLEGLALDWWEYYLWYFSLALPVIAINSFMRGIFQAHKEYTPILKAEGFSRWLFALPILVFGMVYDKPQIAWSWLLLSEIVEVMYYWASMKGAQVLVLKKAS